MGEYKSRLRLTEYEKVRMSEDLTLGANLSITLKKNQYLPLLDGGYGVDAVCRGRITRFHHDLDLIILYKGHGLDLRQLVVASLNSNGWKENETSPGWLWFTKNDLVLPDTPRQINIHTIGLVENHLRDGFFLVRSRKGNEYQMSFHRTLIADSMGNNYEFFTLTAEEYAASKLRLIPVYAPNWLIRESDQHDLSLLFRSRGFSFEKCVSILSSYYLTVLGSGRSRTKSYSAKKILIRLVKTYPEILSGNRVEELKKVLDA